MLVMPYIWLNVVKSTRLQNHSKALRGLGGKEVVEDFDGETYRAVYTLKLAGVVYVLHAFEKKSKKGIATPKQDIELIEARFKRAKEHYSENYIN